MKTVVSKNKNLIFNVDGKDVAPVAYMSYLPALASYQEFHGLGYELFSACIYLGGMPVNELSGIHAFEPPIWKSRDVYDFSVVDNVVRRALGDVPKGYLMLRVNVNVPRWWREENPDELVELSNGKKSMQSSFSKKWIQDIQGCFDRLKAHIESSAYAKNVIAWQIAAMNTEEWIAPLDGSDEPDFSPCARKGFAEWCKKKYMHISALNDIWGTAYLDFSEVAIPSKEQRAKHNEEDIVDLVTNAQVIDYYRCFNQSYAGAIESLASYVKKIFNNDILVGCFYGYIGQLGCYTGHCAFNDILHSKNIDFFASPYAYTEDRQTAKDWFYHGAMQSCERAGKLWFLEGDIRTLQTKALHESAPSMVDKDNARMNLRVWFGPATEEMSIWHLTRAFGKALISRNAYWWFDMWGGWYNTPKMLSFMKQSRDLYVSAMSKPIETLSEVVVVLDQDASYGMRKSYYGRTYYQQLMALGDIGVPYDLCLKGDFAAKDLSKYKCVLYLAPFKITSEDECVIRELVAAGKKVVLTGKDYSFIDKKVNNVARMLLKEELLACFCAAGVHIYIEQTGLIFANGDFICITAAETENYTITMPFDCLLKDPFSGECHSTQGKKVCLQLQKNQSKLFKIEK